MELSRGGIAPSQGRNQPRFRAGSVPFEILHGALVLFRCRAGFEGSKVATLTGFRVDFTGIEPVFARLQFSDHGKSRLVGQPLSAIIAPRGLLFRAGYSRCLQALRCRIALPVRNEWGPSVQHFFLYLLALGAGVSVATQQVLNGSLRTALGSPASPAASP